MSVSTCLLSLYVASSTVVTNTMDVAIKSGVAAAVTAAANQRRPQLVEFITPAALAVFLLFWSVVIVFYRLSEPVPVAANKQQQEQPQQQQQQQQPTTTNTTTTTTTVVAKRSKTKPACKDDCSGLDAEDPSTSSPPSKISKKSASDAGKPKPSPPPSPEKVRKAAVSPAAVESPPALDRRGVVVQDHHHRPGAGGHGNEDGDEDDCSSTTSSGGGSSSSSNNNDDDDDENNSCSSSVVSVSSSTGTNGSGCDGVHRQHQPAHKQQPRRRRSVAPSPVAVAKPSAKPATCKPTALAATDVERPPPERHAAPRAGTPSREAQGPPTTGSDDRTADKVFLEKKTTTTGKRTMADLFKQQNVTVDGGRNKKETNPPENAAKLPQQNKENVEPRAVDEDNDKADRRGHNDDDDEDEFGPLLRAPKKRPGKRTRKRAKKNKQQLVPDDAAAGPDEATAAAAAEDLQPAANDDGDVATAEPADAQPSQPEPEPYAGSEQRAALSHLSNLQIWFLLCEYQVPQRDLYGCGVPVTSALTPHGSAVFYRANMRTKKLNPVAKEFSVDEQRCRSAASSSIAPPDRERDSEQVSFRELVSCARCSTLFKAKGEMDVAAPGRCVYHHGKLLHHQDAPPGVYYGGACSRYDCCDGDQTSPGCTTAPCHVWNGYAEGHNGPVSGYVWTCAGEEGWPPGASAEATAVAVAAAADPAACRVYGIDCEMCYTEGGLEATKVTLVDLDGAVVYDSLIRPEKPIVDYNTRFSGISVQDFRPGSASKSLDEVRADLARYIRRDTILVGHGLGSDLQVLHMVHQRVVDTTVMIPPPKRSLKFLAKTLLKREIQHAYGHDSVEDARAAVDLTLFKLHSDLKSRKSPVSIHSLYTYQFHYDRRRHQLQQQQEEQQRYQQHQQQQQHHHQQQQHHQHQLQQNNQQHHRQNRRGRHGRRRGGDDDDDGSSSSSSSSRGGHTSTASCGSDTVAAARS